MSLSEKDVIQVAQLARIAINDEEKKHLQTELSDILNWVTMLQQANVKTVAPEKQTATTHTDTISEGNQQEAILKNAPKKQYGFFVVPKMVE